MRQICKYICHCIEGDQIIPNPYPLGSIIIDKVWWSLLSGTPVFVVGHIALVVPQAKKAYKDWFPIA